MRVGKEKELEIDVYVGNRLRLRRTILGISQDVLGNAVGVTFQQIQKYEKGINRISASRMFLLAITLEVPVEYFFDGLTDLAEYADCPQNQLGSIRKDFAENDIDADEHEKLTTRETLELARAFYKITSPSQRKCVFELIKSISKYGE